MTGVEDGVTAHEDGAAAREEGVRAHEGGAAARQDGVPARADDRRSRGGRRGRRGPLNWVAALVVVGVLLLSAVGLTLYPAGPVQGTQTQSVQGTGVSGRIVPGMVITQPVLATQDGLTRVQATFGTYGGARDCSLDVVVSDDAGEVVGRNTLSCEDIVDTSAGTVVAEFAPVEDSADRTFTVSYEGMDDGPDRVALWVGEPEGIVLPAEVDGAPAEVEELFAGGVATATVVEYEGASTWAQVGAALERMSLGGPWWSQPAAMIVWTVGLVALAAGAVLTAGRRWGLTATFLVLLALCRGLVWASAIPPLEGMDEWSHVDYAQFLAEESRLPEAGELYQGRAEYYSPQITALDEFRNRTALPPGDRSELTEQAIDELDAELLAASPDSNGAAPAAGYPPAYYLPSAVLYDITPGTLNDKIYGMRLWSVALGMLAAAATFFAARRLLPRWNVAPVLLSLAVILQPMMAHQFAIVNNDALVIAAGIGAFAVALKLATGRFRSLDVAWAGALVGLALLAKPYGIGVLPVVGVGLLIGSPRRPGGLGRFFRGMLAGIGGIAATYGVWVVLRRVLDLQAAKLPGPDGINVGRGLVDYLRLQAQDGFAKIRLRWGEQLFGMFSWLDIRLPQNAYVGVLWFLLVAVVLAAVWVLWQLVLMVRRGREQRFWSRYWADDDVVPVWMSLAMIVGMMGALLAAGWLSFRNDGNDGLLQGRYALAAVPALLALPALTIKGYVLPDRTVWARVMPTVVLGVVALGIWTIHLLGLAAVVDRFYL